MEERGTVGGATKVTTARSDLAKKVLSMHGGEEATLSLGWTLERDPFLLPVVECPPLFAISSWP
jgi:hypothetical protein